LKILKNRDINKPNKQHRLKPIENDYIPNEKCLTTSSLKGIMDF
jgi:hypothetical protein